MDINNYCVLYHWEVLFDLPKHKFDPCQKFLNSSLWGEVLNSRVRLVVVWVIRNGPSKPEFWFLDSHNRRRKPAPQSHLLISTHTCWWRAHACTWAHTWIHTNKWSNESSCLNCLQIFGSVHKVSHLFSPSQITGCQAWYFIYRGHQ